jgi:hypothetical protein
MVLLVEHNLFDSNFSGAALYLQCRYAVNTSSVIFTLTMSLRISEPYGVISFTLACACTQGSGHFSVLAH